MSFFKAKTRERTCITIQPKASRVTHVLNIAPILCVLYMAGSYRMYGELILLEC